MSVVVQMQKPGNETPEHYALKLHAFAWLWRSRGCRAIGFEVPCVAENFVQQFARLGDALGVTSQLSQCIARLDSLAP